MSDNATIHDEAPARKYFTQMLNMAEDDLDPFQYRLLAHYIRWYDGKPYPESIRQTASATKMSVNKVQSALDELSALGYLEVYRPTQQEARNGATIKVKVIDRWMENINRYQRKPVSNSTQAVSEKTQGCIKNDTPPVLNMICLEEQKKEEQEPITRKSAKGSKTPTIPAEQMNPMKDALVEAFGWSWKNMTKTESGIIQSTAKELCAAGFEADRVASFHAWCKAKFTTFTPRVMATHLSEYRNSRLNGNAEPKKVYAAPYHKPMVIEEKPDAIPMPQEAKDAIQMLKDKMYVKDGYHAAKTTD